MRRKSSSLAFRIQLISVFIFIICITCIKSIYAIQQHYQVNENEQLDEYTGPFYVSEVPSPLSTNRVNTSSHATILTYKMPSVRGDMINAIATIWWPNNEQNIDEDGPRRIVVHNHGTVGTSTHCSTSYRNSELSISMVKIIGAVLKRGYVLVYPDYEGLGITTYDDDGEKILHPYLNLKSGAYSTIYAIKALREKYGNFFHEDFGCFGQSQGAHTTFGVARYAPQMITGLKAAVVCASPARVYHVTDVIFPANLPLILAAEQNGLMPKNTAVGLLADVLVFSTYLSIGIKAEDSSFNHTESVFEPYSAQTAIHVEEGFNIVDGQDAYGLCFYTARQAFVDSILQWLNDEEQIINNKTLLDYPGLKPGVNQIPQVKKWFDDNEPDNEKIDLPIMVIHGQLDSMVPVVIADWVVGNMTALGTNVTYIVLPNGIHTTGIVDNLEQYLDFIEEYVPPKTKRKDDNANNNSFNNYNYNIYNFIIYIIIINIIAMFSLYN